MAKRYLIDTSGVIKYLNRSFPKPGITFLNKTLDRESIISFITEIELLSWNPPDESDLKIYQTFVTNSLRIGINDEIISEAIRIRKEFKLKLPDAIIAATALTNDLTLIADNDKDFSHIQELNYLNPNQIKK